MSASSGRRASPPAPASPTTRWEREALREGFAVLAGLDEAGRGALAGPVVAAAVVLDPSAPLPGIRDSKQLPAAARTTLAALIKEHALAWAIGVAASELVDRVNILRATHLAMREALDGLAVRPDLVLVDGLAVPTLACPSRAIVQGDRHSYLIAAASIVAKVERDALMVALDAQHPQYGFAQHKGYGTAAHRQALAECGPCPAHRRSFAPVAQWEQEALFEDE